MKGSNTNNLSFNLGEQWYRSLFINKSGAKIFKKILSDIITFKKQQEIQNMFKNRILENLKNNHHLIEETLKCKDKLQLSKDIAVPNESNLYAHETLNKDAVTIKTIKEKKLFQLISRIHHIINMILQSIIDTQIDTQVSI